MENNEIKALIDKYGLYVDWSGERVGARKASTKNISREQFVKECSPHKAEIIAYFKAEKKVKEELRAKQKATFNAIPGVPEVRQAREQRAKWLRELNWMIEEGNPVQGPDTGRAGFFGDPLPYGRLCAGGRRLCLHYSQRGALRYLERYLQRPL